MLAQGRGVKVLLEWCFKYILDELILVRACPSNPSIDSYLYLKIAHRDPLCPLKLRCTTAHNTHPPLQSLSAHSCTVSVCCRSQCSISVDPQSFKTLWHLSPRSPAYQPACLHWPRFTKTALHRIIKRLESNKTGQC